MDKNDPRKPPTDEELEGINENWTDAETEASTETPTNQPAGAPEIGRPAQPIPGLIKSTESTNPLVADAETEDEEVEEDGPEEPAGEYDPYRGDHVDVLNDTTPPPVSQPVRPVAVPKQKGKKKRWPWIVLLLLLLAGGAYFIFGSHKAAAPAPKQVTVTKTTVSTAPATLATTHYDSTTYSMGVDYPTTWKLNDGGTSLTVTSPAISLKKSDGTQTSGYIQLSIEATQTSLPQFAKGPATAVLPSERLTYTNPTPNQRSATNLTFASYSTTANNGWDALYVTGDNAYTLGQTIPMADIIQTDPLVQVHFLTCTDQTCAGTPTALSLQASEWKNPAVSLPIKTIIQSFTFN